MDAVFLQCLSLPSFCLFFHLYIGCHEWSLCPHVVAGRIDQKKNNSGSHRSYPNYEMTCHVKRKPNFYMWNVALIMVGVREKFAL